MNSLNIEVANRQAQSIDEDRLVSAVRVIVHEHGFSSGEISIAVVDDPEMKKLNRTYLEHDYETDVLSFVMEIDEEAGHLDGQLILSMDTAIREATQLGIGSQDELLFYAVHGALHLVGFRDKSAEAATEMRLAEADYLNRMNVEHVWPHGTGGDENIGEDNEGGQEVAV